MGGGRRMQECEDRGQGGGGGGMQSDWWHHRGPQEGLGTEGHKRPGQVGDGGDPREGRRRVLRAGPSLVPAPRL